MMAGAATSQRTAAIPGMAPSAARLSFSGAALRAAAGIAAVLVRSPALGVPFRISVEGVPFRVSSAGIRIEGCGVGRLGLGLQLGEGARCAPDSIHNVGCCGLAFGGGGLG